jgi:hypothetical protein
VLSLLRSTSINFLHNVSLIHGGEKSPNSNRSVTRRWMERLDRHLIFPESWSLKINAIVSVVKIKLSRPVTELLIRALAPA